MKSGSRESLMTDADFMKAVEAINSIDNVKDLINVIPTIANVKMASYHHFPAVGSVGFKNLSQYFPYNIPQIALNHYDNKDQPRDDPGIIACFQKGQFIWLSDMPNEPYVIEQQFEPVFERALRVSGEGLCIPLYGPNNRKGYFFIAFEDVTKKTTCFFPFKVQALVQVLHSRYCILIERIQVHAQLTQREAEVLELISFGKTNIEVGSILEISSNTVAVYVKRIFIKLNVSDRVSAAMRAQTIKIKI